MKRRVLYVKGGNVAEEMLRLAPRTGELPVGGPDKFLLAVLHYARDDALRLASVGAANLRRTMGTAQVVEYGARPQGVPSVVKRLWSVLALARMAFDAVRWRPDVTICGIDGPLALPLLLAAKASRGRFIFSAHNALALPQTSAAYKWSNRLLCRMADTVLAHGPFVAHEAARLGAPAANVLEFNNGLDAADLQRIRAALAARPQQTRETVVLYVGRVEASKGVFDLLQAMERLPVRHDARLRYIGDGSALAELRSRVGRSAWASNIEVLGPMAHPQVFEQMAAATVVVTPSQGRFPEGFCKSAMEAMFLCVPVVAPDYGPFPYMVKHDSNGLLYRTDSVPDLSHALQRLLDSPPLCRRLAEGARASGLQFMSPELVYSDAIRRVLSDA